MITLTKIRALVLSAAPAAGRPMHLSAASGLVCLNSFMYVIADDELHLGVFAAAGSEPGHLIRLLEGELPAGKKNRKKEKPDIEGLTVLPPYARYPYGALLAVGSGSRPNRRLGILLGLDASGAVVGSPHVVDLEPILAPLQEEFEALNIEGVVVSGDELRLLQRGNKRYSTNAIISFQLSGLLDALRSGSDRPIKPSAIVPVDLGEIDGIPLCFTDGAALPDGETIFTAVAEDTDDPYDDGPCAGAAIGIVDRNGALSSVQRLDHPHKIEGLYARMEGGGVQLLLVTDADDAKVPARLYAASFRR